SMCLTRTRSPSGLIFVLAVVLILSVTVQLGEISARAALEAARSGKIGKRLLLVLVVIHDFEVGIDHVVVFTGRASGSGGTRFRSGSRLIARRAGTRLAVNIARHVGHRLRQF